LFRSSLSNELKPTVERMINEQVASLQERLGGSSLIEQSARQQWAQMCRAIPLGAAGPGAPNLWLEVRPTRAFAAQPSIDQSAVVLTFGVQAETRIVPSAAKPRLTIRVEVGWGAEMGGGRGQLCRPNGYSVHRDQPAARGETKGKDFPRRQERTLHRHDRRHQSRSVRRPAADVGARQGQRDQ